METLKQRQKVEAIKRMKMLQIMNSVIDDFKKNDKVYYSERQNSFFNATLYWLDNNPEWVNMVKEFEKKWKTLVYHAQLTHTEVGDILSLFYVGKDEDTWEQDKDDIEKHLVFAKCVNLDNEYFSEYSYIGVRPSMGGVVRTS